MYRRFVVTSRLFASIPAILLTQMYDLLFQPVVTVCSAAVHLLSEGSMCAKYAIMQSAWKNRLIWLSTQTTAAAPSAFYRGIKTTNPNLPPVCERFGFALFGTPEGTRTPNPRNRNPMLYPLSHWRICSLCIIAGFVWFVKCFFVTSSFCLCAQETNGANAWEKIGNRHIGPMN